MRTNIHLLHEDELKLQHNLESLSNFTTNNLQRVEQRLNKIESVVHNEQLLILHDREAIGHATTICQGLLQAHRGVLEPSLVHPEEAEKSLARAEKKLLLTARIALSSVMGLYSQRASLSKNDSHFHISVDLPICNKFAWEAFQLTSPLLLVHGKLAELLVPDIILLHNELHCTLSLRRWDKCQHHPDYLCPFPVSSESTESCVPALLSGDHGQIDENCEIHFLKARTTTKASNSWVYIYHQKMERVLISCQGKRNKYIEFQGLRQFRRQQCVFRGDSFHIGRSISNISQELNLAFLNASGGAAQEMLNWVHAGDLSLQLGELSHLRLHNFSDASFDKTHAGKALQSLAAGVEAVGDSISNGWHFFVHSIYAAVALAVAGLCVTACIMWRYRPRPEQAVSAMWKAIAEPPTTPMRRTKEEEKKPGELKETAF